mmetsp:Transcript_2033/g.6398  ORF Transcript_2033/g.6398 Transcript_2033/m.6398 type:complete len:250 (+) Transcript_2033:509-1258(+)
MNLSICCSPRSGSVTLFCHASPLGKHSSNSTSSNLECLYWNWVFRVARLNSLVCSTQKSIRILSNVLKEKPHTPVTALDDHDHKSTPLPPRRPDSVAVIVLVLVLVLALVLDLDRLRRDEAGHLARGHDHPVHIAPPPPPIRPLPLLVARHPLIVPGPHATGGIAHDHVHRTAQSRTATNVGARDIRALGLLPPLLVLLPREVVAIALQRVVVIVVPRAVLDVSALVLALRVVTPNKTPPRSPSTILRR